MNDQLDVVANAFPEMSVTPPVPPATLAVYTAPPANAVLGVNVAMRVAVAYETVPATATAAASLSWNVPPLIVAAFIVSLKVTVTVVVLATPVAPAAGVLAVMVGAAVSTDATMSAWI